MKALDWTNCAMTERRIVVGVSCVGGGSDLRKATESSLEYIVGMHMQVKDFTHLYSPSMLFNKS